MRKYGLKIAALLLSVVFVFAVFPSLKSNAATMNYSFDADTGTLTISGDGEITADAVSNEIGSFYSATRSNLKVVIIDYGVTAIGDSSFALCSGLTQIEIPTTVDSIGYEAFVNCSSLAQIDFPSNGIKILGCAFQGCTSLESLTFPNFTAVHQGAFRSCTGLKSLTFSGSYFYLNSETFWDCTGLTSVVIEKGLYDKYRDECFNSCIDNTSFHCYFNATYSSEGHGTVDGNAVTYGTDKFTVIPDANYVVDTIVFKDADGYETKITPDENGICIMPDLDNSKGNRNVTIIASFKPIQKTVTFYDEDGTTILLSDSYDYGKAPSYSGDTPTKPADAQYTYTFAGWTDGTNEYKPTDTLPKVTDDATYTAMYTGTTNVYTVTFTDDKGKELLSSDVKYGEAPEYTGDKPTKAETDKYTYTFAGWIDGANNKYGPTDTLPEVKGDVTYNAVFTETAKPEPDEPVKTVENPVQTVEAPVQPSETPVQPSEEPEKPVLPNDYYVESVVGDGSQGSVVITVKAKGDIDNSFELLDRVEAGGKTLAVGSDIEVNQGSTIITLKKSYIDTLTDGLNSITVYFKDGGSITVNFNVKKAAATNASAVPATGEAMSISTFTGVGLIMTAVSLVGYNVMKKREEEN